MEPLNSQTCEEPRECWKTNKCMAVVRAGMGVTARVGIWAGEGARVRAGVDIGIACTGTGTGAGIGIDMGVKIGRVGTDMVLQFPVIFFILFTYAFLSYQLTVWAPPTVLHNLIAGEEEYEIDWILCHRGSPSQWSFLIWWRGYSAKEDSWIPEWDLKNANSALNDYKKQHPTIFSP